MKWIQEGRENYVMRNHIALPSLMLLVIKSRRMEQGAHAACKSEVRNVNRILVETTQSKISFGRHKNERMN
jgi:hypothetical protein